jgi:hypothetical protein
MSVRSIPLAESTPDQRRKFVTDFLNLELEPNATDQQVNALISRAQPESKLIFVLEDAPEEELILDTPADQLAPEEGGGRMVGSLGKSDPRWLIVIPTMETEDGSGGRDVLVGVNGRAWQIRRGAEVSVPHRVIVALDNAVQHVLRHEDDGAGNVNEVRRQSKRFSYEVVERPTQAAIDAWEVAIGAEFCA